MSVQSISAVQKQIDGKTMLSVETSIGELEKDMDELERTLTRAIEDKSLAEKDVEAISGDADVATLVARRQTIELEMQETILKHFELKIGHRIADQAINRYRDTHRSGMMESAQEAFNLLAAGKYNRITSQNDGTKETLVAVQSSDQTAKQVDALSKGARFQFYLALRAAAYEQMASNGTILPFFCDDVFETFDGDRTRAACRLMHRIGKTGQAI